MDEQGGDKSFSDCLRDDYKHGQEDFWISGVCLSIAGILGIVGNLFNLVVFTQPAIRKKMFNRLLLALTCFDTLFILSYGINVAYKSLDCHHFVKLVGCIAYPLQNIGLVGSNYMTVAISLERYLGICHPKWVQRRSLYFIVPVLFITFAYNSPRFFEQECSVTNGIAVVQSTHWRGEEYKQGYYLWASLVIKTILPCASLVYLNGAIFAEIRNSAKACKKMGKIHQKGSKKTTKILFWIVFIFFILHTPRVVFKCLYYSGIEDGNWYVVLPIYRLALIINSSVNFIVYCTVCKIFRKELIRVFRFRQLIATIMHHQQTNQEKSINLSISVPSEISQMELIRQEA